MSLRSAADTTVSFSQMDDAPARQDGLGALPYDPGVPVVVMRVDRPEGSEGGALPDPDSAAGLTPGPALTAGASRIRGSRVKRGLDLGFAVLALVFTSPFLLALALFIRLETPGPALFKQRRTGRDGQTFTIYKFRTMRVVEDGVEIVQASENDQRTTPLGRFLRRSSVDELPQLLNVLKGEMSLIGPRPHALAHDAYYGARVPGYETRFLVRPGLSGLAQVRGCRGATPETEMMAARVQWDLAYIENWSLGLEAQIFLETIRVFFLHPAPF
jgi:lipopolysaccharide/colanic/teichoic acid biosynthesis glycosyltransferase